MSASERTKGARGELEVCALLRACGWNGAQRSSDGRTQARRGDIVGGPAGVFWDVKRRERIDLWRCLAEVEAAAPADAIRVLAFRRSRSDWYAAVPLDDLLYLLTARDR